MIVTCVAVCVACYRLVWLIMRSLQPRAPWHSPGSALHCAGKCFTIIKTRHAREGGVPAECGVNGSGKAVQHE